MDCAKPVTIKIGELSPAITSCIEGASGSKGVFYGPLPWSRWLVMLLCGVCSKVNKRNTLGKRKKKWDWGKICFGCHLPNIGVNDHHTSREARSLVVDIEAGTTLLAAFADSLLSQLGPSLRKTAGVKSGTGR